MSGTVPGTKVTQKAIVARDADQALAAPVVIDAAAGASGTVLQAGQVLTKQSNGKYLPADGDDTFAVGSTKVLAQTITLDGEDKTGVSAFFGGHLVKASLIGNATLLAALGVEHTPGVITLKQW